MKTTVSLFTKITLGVLIAAGMAACTQNKTADKPAAPAAASTKPEIVYINLDTINTKYEGMKDMRKRLEDKGKTTQNDVGGKRQALQREIAEYQKNAATMSADQRAATEQRLQREGQTEQAYEQNASAQMQNTQADETKKIYDKLYDFTKQYAKENGHKMIETFQNGNTQLLYADPSLDVTIDFLKKLNDAYAKEKK
ncbi:MAG: OmpH family outer membrane protein [Bacteroidota bacterium]